VYTEQLCWRAIIDDHVRHLWSYDLMGPYGDMEMNLLLLLLLLLGRIAVLHMQMQPIVIDQVV